MTINNFNTSSTGIELELSCFHDNDLSRIWFNDNFKVVKHNGYRVTPHYLYTEGGEYSAFECDVYFPESEVKLLAKAYGKKYYQGDVKGFLEDFRYYQGPLHSATIQDLKDFWDNAIGDSDLDKMAFLSEYGEPNYKMVSATGFSQGDYAEIIVPKDSYAFKNDSLDFDNMIYNAPLYIRLDINGEEYYIDQELKDCYSYDQKEILGIVSKLLADHKEKEYILAWLEENLPEYPDSI